MQIFGTLKWYFHSTFYKYREFYQYIYRRKGNNRQRTAAVRNFTHKNHSSLHHKDKLIIKAICRVFQIRREGKHLNNLTTNCSLNVNNKFLFIFRLIRIKCESVLTTAVPSRSSNITFCLHCFATRAW